MEASILHSVLLNIVTDKSKAQSEFEKLIQALAKVGLQVNVRNGDNQSLLVFVKAANAKKFDNALYKSR